MATFKPATPQQLEEIRASVKVAVEELKRISWNVHKPKRGSAHVPNQPRAPDNAACRKYLKTPRVRHMVRDWLNKGDGYSLVRFGRELSQMFVFIEETKYPLVPAFPCFLVSHWAERKDGFPEFCYLTPSDITALWIQFWGDKTIPEEISEDSVSKMRGRLKLKPFRRKLHSKTVFTKDGSTKIIFPELDK